jgi:hypothetical protein
LAHSSEGQGYLPCTITTHVKNVQTSFSRTNVDKIMAKSEVIQLK